MELDHSLEHATPTPRHNCPAVCCISGQVENRRRITSAVQRSLLDRFGHGGAKERDDGARVVAAYHSAAGHDHVGSGLDQRGEKKPHNLNLPTAARAICPTCVWVSHLCTLVDGVGTDASVNFNV